MRTEVLAHLLGSQYPNWLYLASKPQENVVYYFNKQ